MFWFSTSVCFWMEVNHLVGTLRRSKLFSLLVEKYKKYIGKIFFIIENVQIVFAVKNV